MKTYDIKMGTNGILITQEPNVDLTLKNFSVRKNLRYTDDNVLVDPNKFAAHKFAAYDRGSKAADLANRNYFVFSEVKNDASRYMIAIPAEEINIS